MQLRKTILFRFDEDDFGRLLNRKFVDNKSTTCNTCPTSLVSLCEAGNDPKPQDKVRD